MDIKQSYLMWAGSEHYKTIADWTEEAITKGVSKRLPGTGVGTKIMDEDTVIFVAHDEGQYTDCQHCLGTIECPDCRKTGTEIARTKKELDGFFTKFFKGDRENMEKVLTTGAQRRFVAVRDARLEKLDDALTSCETCDGMNELEAGTGGHVTLKDGTLMDYRTFNYWLHQPARFDPETVRIDGQCPACGGTGKVPCSKVFGMFIPESIEYIVSGDEDKEALEKVAKFAKISAAQLALEPKRKCGRRKPGGTYASTSVEGDPEKLKAAIQKMVEKGIIKPESTEVHGSFVRFIEPIEIEAKRFRGIKSWSLDPAAEDAAQDVLAAL